MKKRILIVASWRMQHVRRYVNNLIAVKGADLIVDFLDNSYGFDNIAINGVDHLYTIEQTLFNRILIRIPKLRMFLVKKKTCKMVEKLIQENKYDMVNMQVVYDYAVIVMKSCQVNNVKTLLSPFGSEVIRVSAKQKRRLRGAFDRATFVATKENSSFSEYLSKTYGVDDSKFVSYGAGSETISSIIKLKGKSSREQMSYELGIPVSNYNICCGYNAQKAQRHKEMLKALADNKEYLPNDYQILIPLTYGEGKKQLLEELKNMSKELSLKTVFFTDYMSADNVALLRLVTDLFVHVQTTDAANASLQEFMLAGATCINGKWLSYPYLEADGIPYYQCESIHNLGRTIKKALLSENAPVPLSAGTIKTIEDCSIESVVSNWKNFFMNS